MTRPPRGAVALAAAALIVGCAGCAAPRGSVVLLPSSEGRDTAVLVTQGGADLLLTQPYAAAQFARRGPQAYQSDAEQVRARFAATLDALPLPPAQFTLYFVEGKDELTDASRLLIDGVLDEIGRRPVPDVQVIGLTDTVGNDAYNDNLSRQRADVVRQALLARGIAVDNVLTIGRGRRELMVPTADGVAEPRNRRVEIQVR